MSETPKRCRGDRRDAVLLRETDALHFIMGIIYPHRADNEAYIAERIDLEPIKAYLAKKNVEGIEFKYTFFHVIVADGAAEVILNDSSLLEAHRLELPLCFAGRKA